MNDYHPQHKTYTCRDCGYTRDNDYLSVIDMRHTIDENDATFMCLVCAGRRRTKERIAAGDPLNTYRPQLVREPRYTDKPIERMTALDWYWEDQYREDEINREDMDQAGANGAR